MVGVEECSHARELGGGCARERERRFVHTRTAVPRIGRVCGARVVWGLGVACLDDVCSGRNGG